MTSVLEYIWIDAELNLRSKTRVEQFHITTIKDIRIWNYDGSSTGQATTSESEILLKPVYYCVSPFSHMSNYYLVLCATYDKTGKPALNNNYSEAKKIFKARLSNANLPWYGLEQEFYFEQMQKTSVPNVTNTHYCGTVDIDPIQKKIMDDLVDHCIRAGLTISGINAEVGRNQWEFQIGPVMGIDAAHQLWMARYILNRIANKSMYKINYHPKPYGQNFSGSGLHTNFSTKDMRNENGLEIIVNSMKKLELNHSDYIDSCGADNTLRLTGHHETSDINTFTYGIADRTASVRIPSETYRMKCGYFEDRRPGANADPYIITSKLYKHVTDIDDVV